MILSLIRICKNATGAGKTETTKLCLSFLSEMATSDVEGSQGMEQKILASNPILESFGNAKTLRNNNSSRYGKFINLIFNDAGILQGCETKNFLLEKSRVHMQAFGERSYHIFYQLCRAAIEEADCFSFEEFGNIIKEHDNEHYKASAASLQSSTMRANLSALGLKHPDEFNYLNQSGCTDIYLVSDQENFHEMEFAATKLGFSKKQLNSIFSTCACVLHLGNLSFKNNEVDGGCHIEETDMCFEALERVAVLLDVSRDQVTQALTKRELHARGEVTLVLLSAAQASEARDALAKYMYMTCFDFLINVINDELSVEAFQGMRTNFSPHTCIGVLDIYGFEVFEMNGFEQLFINYANEKLQQHFNQHTFEEEIRACERENISCEDFTYLDNQETLDLFESKKSGRSGGILHILDDESKFPRGNDEAFLNKLKVSQKDNPLISFSKKFSDLGFDILHYAGSVNYTVKDFVEKNKDTLSDDLESLMFKSSVKDLIPAAGLCNSVRIAGRAKIKQLTVAGKFQKDLHNLLVQLNASEPHFIRCIKPNEEKEPMIFNHALVHRQLKQSGAFDALSIRKRGFQFQYPHAIFIQRYRPLVVEHKAHLDSNKPMRNRCLDLINTLSSKIKGMKSLSENMQVGDTMVFWKSAEDVMLSELRKSVVRDAVLVLQRFIRGGVTRCRLMKLKKVVAECKSLIADHDVLKKTGKLVTFESECEVFQALTLHKDYFDSLENRPLFDKALSETLLELEERIDCINQLQLHYHKTLHNIDEGWLAATEKAIALNLHTIESEHMIDIYRREIKNHGNLLVHIAKQIQSQDVDVNEIKESVNAIDEIRRSDPLFASEILNTLKKNVAILEEENNLVSTLLKTSQADIIGDNTKDHFLPFCKHLSDEKSSLSANFGLVLKVVDFVMEMRDVVLTTLLCATGEDPSFVPFIPPPDIPKNNGDQDCKTDAEREVDFEDDGFEKPAIVHMSGCVSTKMLENELWSASRKQFHLFDDIREDLSGKEEFGAVLELAGREVTNYKEAVTRCHATVQECAHVLNKKDIVQSALARQNINDFNEFVSEKCFLLTCKSSRCENDFVNTSHPYFSKRLDLENKKLFSTQYSLLLKLENASNAEKQASIVVLQSAKVCADFFREGDYNSNKDYVSALQHALMSLTELKGDGDSFVYPTSSNVHSCATYTIAVRQLANDILKNPHARRDSASLDELEDILMKSTSYENIELFFAQEELNAFREEVFKIKVKNSEVADSKKQFISDLSRAIDKEDEGLLTFLLTKISTQEFEADSSIDALVDQGYEILTKLKKLKMLVNLASKPEATIAFIQQTIAEIQGLGCKGSGPHLEALQSRLDSLLVCGRRIHSAWYDYPNSIENMVGALQECSLLNYPSCDDVNFVQYLVDLWREDYSLYLKALIDLRTFLEDNVAVNELNEELNKLYMKDKVDVEEDDSNDHDPGNRITEDVVLKSKVEDVSDIEVSLQDVDLNVESTKAQSTLPSPKKKNRAIKRVRYGSRRRANSDNFMEKNTDQYKWYKYPQLRTFTDPERERQRKVYTTSNIPTSVTRLDNIIHIQLATAAFKCLLGIMGDKVGTYPEMLKKEFLRIATYHITLTDELYCQVMKQLTKNPSRVSKAKGVELLQLLVSTVLPTQELLPYLENFLRSHGALEFVNLLRVLSVKKTAKADKAAESDCEGWLYITVGRIMKSYRKRWCILHGDSLSIFMNKDHNSKLESLHVNQIKSLHYIKRKDENVKAMYAFEIEMKNDKKHLFFAA